jgi:hypothetical protein
MTTKTESFHSGEFILSEGNGAISREEITVVSGQDLVAGQVVGKISVGGKYKDYDNGASDGSQTAAGILLDAVDASGGDKKGVIIESDAEVKGDALDWGSETGSDITAGIADLLARGIKVR